MAGYDSWPPVRRTIPIAKRQFKVGTPCPVCGLLRPAGWVGRCRSCLDARHLARSGEAEE